MTMQKQATKNSEATVTINVPLPHDLHRRLRMRAVQNDKTLKAAVIEAITEWSRKR